MNRVSRDVERRVFDLHFKGVPRDAIAGEIGVSSATVSEILSVLPSQLDSLRVLSVELRKNDMILRDALAGISIINDLLGFGIESKQFSSSLKAVMKMSADNQYKPECVVQAATRLVELEDEAGKGYLMALREFELVIEKSRKKKRRNKELGTRNSQLQSQISENEKLLAQAFEAAAEAPGDISKFKMEKAKLRRYGLSFDDIEVVIKLLENVRQAGGDSKRVVSLVKKVGYLIGEEAALKNCIEEMNREFEYIRSQKENAEAELQRKLNQCSELENRIQSMQCELAVQTSQIQRGCVHLSGISAELCKLDRLRREAISQIGRITGMDDLQIQQLQLEAEFDIAYQTLQKQFDEFLKQRMREFF